MITPDTTIVLATRNKGKVAEFASLLTPFGLTVVGMDAFPDIAEVEETGTTFAENALLKASTVSRLSGLVAVADDSGLEVDALGKAPGVYSARYSATPLAPATDARNIEKLLEAMAGVPHEKRTARFRCAMAASTPSGEQILAQGAWEGFVAEKASGSNGFGYDPVFFDPECTCTAATMDPEEKNRRSHRAAAVKLLLRLWPEFWATWLQSNTGNRA